MNFTREDVNALFSIIPLVLWQIYTPDRRKTMQYEAESKQIRGAPKSYIFGIVWSIIYCLIIASGFIYFRIFQTSKYYLAAAILFLSNILLNKFWSVAYWNNGKRYALIIILVLIITGVAFLALMGLEDAWVSFGLYIPYVIWLCYATYLNYASLRLPKREPPKYYSSGKKLPNIPRVGVSKQWQNK